MPGRSTLILVLLVALTLGFRAWYFTPNAVVRELAPDFTATRLDGHSFQLAALRGGYVLLDFWGSWCGPCRRKSPALVQVHRKYSDEITIVSVAIERDSLAWRRALTQDARLWTNQIMDATTSLKFLNGPIADLYGINRVPANVLIDPDGRVVGVDIPLHEIPHLFGD